MTSDSATATDGPGDTPLPLWQEANARVRRLQRAQLIMLVVAAAAILFVVVAGSFAAVGTLGAQKEAETRANDIRSLRGDFVVRLFEAREGLNQTGGSVDGGTLLEFARLALRTITLANSYEPPNAEERMARDAVLDVYDQFTDLQANTDAELIDATLNGTVGAGLAIEALARFDAWANANARSLGAARDEQDGLIARLAVSVIAVVLLMGIGFLVTWWFIEKARKQALAEAFAQTRRFDSLARNASDIVIVVDAEGGMAYCSESASRLLGWSQDELAQMPFSELVDPEDRGSIGRAFADAAGPDEESDVISWRLRHRDGSSRDAETLATNLLGDPAVSGMVLNSRDVTDRKIAERQLEHQALHDPLTGLANRVLFEDRLTHALAAQARSGDALAVFVLDLDDFKTVNDALGHHAGDELLDTVGRRLSACLRPGDTAARLGGDEYGVVLTSITGAEAARAVAQRIHDAVRGPADIGGERISISASVGIALATGPGDDPQTILRRADLAMYAAKNQSGERIARFSGEMQHALEERMRLRTDLAAAATADDQLVLEYQPVVDLGTGEIVGLEALLRWDHPELDRVMPDQFIPLAEETGLIVPIGERVLRDACRQVAAWRKQDGGDDLAVGVNLSARQLEDPGLVEAVAATLAEHDLPADHLIVEVTESMLMHNLEEAAAALEGLSQLGVRIAVDDFGTGYSSLSQLGNLPVDIVKVDRSFVAQLSTGNFAADLAGIILQLGAVLELRTVAEGIEDASQLAQLQELGCQFGQGYLFARPMPPDAFTAQLKHNGAKIEMSEDATQTA